MKEQCVIVALLIYSAATFTYSEEVSDTKGDLERLQGLWDCSPPGPRSDTPLAKMRISGTNMEYLDAKNQAKPIMEKDGERLTITIAIDDTQSPKHIDMNLEMGKYRNKVLGIYMLDGDHLIMIFGDSDKPRPEVFKAHYGNGKELQAFRRAKVEPEAAAETDDR